MYHTYIHTYIQTYKHTNIQTYKHTYIHTYIHTDYIVEYVLIFIRRCTINHDPRRSSTGRACSVSLGSGRCPWREVVGMRPTCGHKKPQK